MVSKNQNKAILSAIKAFVKTCDDAKNGYAKDLYNITLACCKSYHITSDKSVKNVYNLAKYRLIKAGYKPNSKAHRYLAVHTKQDIIEYKTIKRGLAKYGNSIELSRVYKHLRTNKKDFDFWFFYYLTKSRVISVPLKLFKQVIAISFKVKKCYGKAIINSIAYVSDVADEVKKIKEPPKVLTEADKIAYQLFFDFGLI